MIDIELAEKVVDYLNDLLEKDRPAIAALVGNRIPCNEDLADHSTCQIRCQHGGFSVGTLGLLNGLCGIHENGRGAIVAVFDDVPQDKTTYKGLVKFIVDKGEINKDKNEEEYSTVNHLH